MGARFFKLAVFFVLIVACSEAASDGTVSGTASGAPPREISDVTAILELQKPDEVYRDQLSKSLNAVPPANGSPEILARFYQHRAETAIRAGYRGQAVTDAKDGVDYARIAKKGVREALIVLILAKQYAGENTLSTVNEFRKEGGWVSGGYGISGPGDYSADLALIRASIEAGDLVEAQTILRNADERFVLEAGRPQGFNVGTSGWTVANLRRALATAHGMIAEALGNLSEGELWYRKALVYSEDLFIPWNAPSMRWSIDFRFIIDANIALCRADLVHILLLQHRALEAETVARDGLLYALRRTGKSSGDAADGIAMLGQALYEQARYRDAEVLFRFEVSLRDALGIQATLAQNALADTLAMQRRWPEAAQLYDSIGTTKSAKTLPPAWQDLLRYQDSGGKMRSAELTFPHILTLYQMDPTGDGVGAARSVVSVYLRRYGPDAYLTALAQGYVALGLKLKGDRTQSADLYRETLPKLLTALQPDGRDALRNPVLRVHRQYVLEGNLELLADSSNKAAGLGIEAGFQVADALESGVTDRAVITSAVRAQLTNSELGDLSKREEDTRQQLSAHLELLAGALSQPVEQQNAAALTSLRTDIEKLKQAQATLSQELERRYPEYARLVNPGPATAEEARGALTADEALVALYAGEHESYVWALRKEGPVAFARVALTREQLAERVSRLRHALDPNATTVGEIPPFDVTLGHELYAALLGPVEAGWKGAKRLVVVPSGPLAQMPFSLLVTKPVAQPKDGGGALFSGYKEVPFLARQVAISQVPSVAALVSLRGVAQTNAARRPFVGFGDPLFSPQQAAEAKRESEVAQTAALEARGLYLRAAPKTETMASANLSALPRLPDTAMEVREVGMALHADPSKDIFLEAEANEWQVRNMKLDDRRVVMFATHGLVPGDLDGLDQPALALSAPSVANVQGDGLLTMDKILGLKLDADWVVLSACNTAAGSGAGAEAVSGLGRAFFYAGARALLVTNWSVETVSARKLTTTLFQRQARDPSLSRAEALRQSMLALMDGPGATDPAGRRTLYSYAHPIFWAPYSLVGDGR